MATKAVVAIEARDETDIVDMKEDAMESVQGEKEYYTESEED